MSSFADLFGPDMPLWACEVTSRHVIALGVTPDRRSVASKAAVDLPPGAFLGAVKAANFVDRPAGKRAIEQALGSAGFSGSEIVVVIPDDAVRIALLNVDALPADSAEHARFVRWKLKKVVQFDVESADIAFEKLAKNGSVDLLVVLSPHAVTRQYEEMFGSLGLHAGVVTPSTPAALNLVPMSSDDTLFVKASSESVTTSVFVGGILRFYRKVGAQPLYDAVYPTMMYYEDKLGGRKMRELITCSYGDGSSQAAELGRQLSLPVRELYSSELEGMYKPALGALQP